MEVLERVQELVEMLRLVELLVVAVLAPAEEEEEEEVAEAEAGEDAEVEGVDFQLKLQRYPYSALYFVTEFMKELFMNQYTAVAGSRCQLFVNWWQLARLGGVSTF